jgi:hypothetical protein
MYLCYVDEAGCPGALPSATSPVQPTLVIAGLFVPQQNLTAVTQQFLNLKLKFNPGLRRGRRHFLDSARQEIKGSDLRSDIRRKGRNRRRAVFKFLDDLLTLLENNDCRVVTRIYIKGPGQPFAGIPVYTASMQSICTAFQNFLAEHATHGLIIADHRTPALNSGVSHSIFTQKFRIGGDPYDRVLDMPTFGHSENHIPLQITDLLCSTILTPIASSTYCSPHIASVHVHANDELVRARYALRVRRIAYRYLQRGRWRGGLTVHDAIAQRTPNHMFVP